jgi:hypothetical protein
MPITACKFVLVFQSQVNEFSHAFIHVIFVLTMSFPQATTLHPDLNQVTHFFGKL